MSAKRSGDKGTALSTDAYEVGYGKPPKERRFGTREQPDRLTRRRSSQPPDIAALLDRPMPVKLNGKPAKMHPHEAMLHGLFKRVLAGEIHAIKQFLAECRQAGLLDPSLAATTRAVLVIPKDVPMELAALLVRTAGPPPWDEELYTRLKSDYDRELADLEALKQEAIARARADGEEVY